MELDTETRARIDAMIGGSRVVLFMKGTPEQPRCGFSAATVAILDELTGGDFATVDVLADQDVREGIKRYSEWPTIPQLYVDREFVGGCDIVKEMFNTGALHQALGLEAPDRTPPSVRVSEGAARMIQGALADHPGMAVHLSIDGRWQHGLSLGPAEGHEIRVESGGVILLMDVGTARKAEGLEIDVTDGLAGQQMDIRNPNEPPPVRDMAASELAGRLSAGEDLVVLDTRDAAARAAGAIEGARPLDEQARQAIAGMPRDAALVFVCKVGATSRAAAEHYRSQGYTSVYNLEGGMDAWFREVGTPAGS